MSQAELSSEFSTLARKIMIFKTCSSLICFFSIRFQTSFNRADCLNRSNRKNTDQTAKRPNRTVLFFSEWFGFSPNGSVYRLIKSNHFITVRFVVFPSESRLKAELNCELYIYIDPSLWPQTPNPNPV